MDPHEVVASLQKLVRQQINECEEAIRNHDPVRALNDLADAKTALNEMISRLQG